MDDSCVGCWCGTYQLKLGQLDIQVRAAYRCAKKLLRVQPEVASFPHAAKRVLDLLADSTATESELS